ncbi:MAG: LD-carboxypeptidase [Oscillatoriales cyanobacterium RM1_1_9]|nr:LD-carboxypeptidase [Oscillatoriales cyanobacterium SM2_3_0]NJO47037.1 LD-carboxypeptidase [Oscillatoriales cyanobacterium RM2_1_1]NJO71671.1 LD-carboxypeptidase [Oscillatoriales cyanobacterium RM1_1_9]
MKRRQLLQGLGVSSVLLTQSYRANSASQSPAILKPPRLQRGDTIGLISPANFIEQEDLKKISLKAAQLGFEVKPAPHVLDQYGYLGGLDINRARDINTLFADDTVKALLATTGGWGSSRILPLLDYDLIRSHPKIVLGFSDITALLLGLYSQSQLITFHGFLGLAGWNPPTLKYFEKILLQGEAVTFENPPNFPVQTITPGQAQGRLVGGNLSVLSGLVGSAFVPLWRDKILFVEDVGEDVYRIDRFLTHLKLAGVLDQLSGFIFAQCTRCLDESDPSPTLTLWQVLLDQIRPLGIPAWYGSMMGHVLNQFIVPIGGEVSMDANRGTIQMLETVVV